MAEGATNPTSLPESPRAARPASWRGAAPAEAPRHRWQQAGPAGAPAFGPRWRRLRITVLFGLAAALLVLLLWYVLYAPAQTPVIAIAATNYRWPQGPNAWAAEDLEGLTELHGKTLRIADLSAEWRAPESALARLDSELARLAERRGRSRAIILWISAHGAVDGQGRPCLVLPGSSPLDSKTWLPLATVLEHLQAAGLPDRMSKLLVLDAARQPANWNFGQLDDFAAALAPLVAGSKLPNLAILNSASPGETSLTSGILQRSVFGHYLRLGLAGAADREQGNRDGHVSLRELENYLRQTVSVWAAQHAGAPQTPYVIPANANLDVAWSLRSRELDRWLDEAARTSASAPVRSLSSTAIAPLWKQLDQLRPAKLWRYDPVAWRNIEQRLLLLEKLSTSGKAYAEPARALSGELITEFKRIQESQAAAPAVSSLPAHVSRLAPTNQLPNVTAHSLPLAQFWGSLADNKALELQSALAGIGGGAARQEIPTAIAAQGRAALAAPLDELTLLQHWKRLDVASAWQESSAIGKVFRLHVDAGKLAVPFASATGPGDERAHYWVRPLVDELDRVRRTAEDRLLLGERQAGASIGSTSAEPLVSAPTGLAQRIHSAFADRDLWWAEASYLAAWLCRPQSSRQAEEAADSLVQQVLLPLLADAATLEQNLARSDQAEVSREASWIAESASQALSKRLATLHDHLETKIAELTVAPASPAVVTELDSLLTIPTLPWDVRQRLTQKRIELEIALAGETPLDGSAGRTASAVPRSARWPLHPLAAILQLESTSSGVASPPSLAKLGETIRQHLSQHAQASPAGALASSSPSPSQKLPSDRTLPVLCQRESSFRRAASLWFEAPSSDPVRELRRADLQQLFLWLAARALEDFYGPTRPGQEPHFAIAAADYLAAARALGALSPPLTTEAIRLDGQLASRRVAAQEALAVAANDILLIDQAATVGTTVEVFARSQDAIRDLPAGSAAVFLADDAGRLDLAAWPLALPPAGESPAVLLTEKSILDTAGLKSRGPFVKALATFRGNDFSQQVVLRPPGGREVRYQAPAYGPPQVTVLGHSQKKASVVFILDCSHSMRASAPVESPDANNRAETQRMEVAKGALRALLSDLAERGNMRVGVRLFGHRVGWSTAESDKLLRQTAYAEEISTSLRPYDDVELLLPLGRFDSLVAAPLFDKLQTVRAWGESPLLLALQQAIADFGPDDSAARSVIVITDGQNYQFNPPRELAPALADVTAAAERARVAVHVVGFDIPAAEAPAARRDFDQIAARTGGSFVPATDATALVNNLQRLLRPSTFQVVDASGRIAGEAELGATVTLDDPSAGSEYNVVLDQVRERIAVAGGESIELTVKRGDARLEVIPYLRGNPRFEPLVGLEQARSSPLQVGVHRSIRQPDGVQFPISLHDADGHFVPRPSEMWVEVLPLGAPGELESGPYIFYDTAFLPGTGTPVANFFAANWPANAVKAQVRVWAKPDHSTPTAERPLVEVADRLPEQGLGFAIPGISGVTYQARTQGANGSPFTVAIIERHDDRCAGVGSLKVSLSPPPSSATHQFDAKNKIALHTFRYAAGASDLRSQVQIQFLTRQRAHEHALRTAESITIDVSGRSDLLELTPTTSSDR